MASERKGRYFEKKFSSQRRSYTWFRSPLCLFKLGNFALLVFFKSAAFEVGK